MCELSPSLVAVETSRLDQLISELYALTYEIEPWWSIMEDWLDVNSPEEAREMVVKMPEPVIAWLYLASHVGLKTSMLSGAKTILDEEEDTNG